MNKVNIEVTVRLNTKSNNTLAGFADAFVALPDPFSFHIKGIKIWKNEKSMNVQMPGTVNKTDKQTYFNETFKFDSQSMTNRLSGEVLAAYRALTEATAPIGMAQEEPPVNQTNPFAHIDA